MCRFLLLMTLLWSAAAAADERIAAESREYQRPAGGGPSIDTGYVFLDGRYLPPPYVVASTSAGITVNGQVLSAEVPTPDGPGVRSGVRGNSDGKFEWNSASGGNRFGRRPVNPSGRVARRLQDESVVVSFPGRPLVILEPPTDALDFLRVVADPDPDPAVIGDLLTRIESADQPIWTSWLATFRPSDELRRRAGAVVQAYDAVDSSNKAQIAAVRRLDSFSYPATMLGMVLAVLASGHLLTSIPTRDSDDASASARARIVRASLISVALVFCLSALDLAWTILASQAGQMRELNPIGNRLISDPWWLTVFKSSATVTSCAVLLTLKTHHFARLAAWWLCLVCTILTYRWLAFNSLFLGS